MRRILTFGFSFAGMFCISYYIEKFYVNKGIEYNQIEMVRFSIAFAIISIYYGTKDNKKLISPQLFTIFFYTNIIYIIKI